MANETLTEVALQLRDLIEAVPSASMRLTEIVQHTGEAAWTQVDGNCTVTADTSVWKITNATAASSAKFAIAAGASAGVQAYGQVATDNTSMVTGGYNYIKFWIRSTAALAAGDFQIGLCDTASGTPAAAGLFVDIPAVPATGTWYRMTLALNAAQKALTSVSALQLKMITDATYSGIYIDDVRFCKYDGAGSAITPLQVSTFDNTNADGIDSEMWLLPFAAHNVSVYYLPQHLQLQYYNGTVGSYAATDTALGKSYLRATQTAVDLARPCTAILLTPGTTLAAGEAFEIEVS